MVKRQHPLVLALCLAGLSVFFTTPAYADDTDGDGLPDSWEMSYFGDLDEGTYDDPDTDDYPNIVEYQLATSPILANTESTAYHLNTSLSNADLDEEEGQAVLVEAVDSSQDPVTFPVKFAVVFEEICSDIVVGCS